MKDGITVSPYFKTGQGIEKPESEVVKLEKWKAVRRRTIDIEAKIRIHAKIWMKTMQKLDKFNIRIKLHLGFRPFKNVKQFKNTKMIHNRIARMI